MPKLVQAPGMPKGGEPDKKSERKRRRASKKNAEAGEAVQSVFPSVPGTSTRDPGINPSNGSEGGTSFICALPGIADLQICSQTATEKRRKRQKLKIPEGKVDDTSLQNIISGGVKETQSDNEKSQRRKRQRRSKVLEQKHFSLERREAFAGPENTNADGQNCDSERPSVTASAVLQDTHNISDISPLSNNSQVLSPEFASVHKTLKQIRKRNTRKGMLQGQLLDGASMDRDFQVQNQSRVFPAIHGDDANGPNLAEKGLDFTADASPCINQSSFPFQDKHQWHLNTAVGIQAYSDVKFVEDWQLYCPYSLSSPELSHICIEGQPQISRLPLFGSSHVTTCLDRNQAEYYDMVINAGGPLWALDWCPEKEGWQHMQGTRNEYLAIGVHPHDSPLHRLGEPVYGKGIIQVWAFNVGNVQMHSHEINTNKSRTKRAQRSNQGTKNNLELLPETHIHQNILTNDTHLRNLDQTCMTTQEHEWFSCIGARQMQADDSDTAWSLGRERNLDHPKMVLGLAHDGGITWDAKWQPVKFSLGLDIGELCRLGYLAVLFGDGSVQVFDVPLPSLVENLEAYKGMLNEPLIVQLSPIFRCSGISAADGRRSMPLVLEWSSSPHDRLLVGCHDGVVALFKFMPNASSMHDSRPLMCFVADSAPIRALSWAPDGSEVESKNIAITAGHSGYLKFWDLRDPFYPIWDQVIAKGVCVLCVDWVLNPNYIVLSLDDGSIRLFSIDAAASDTPLTGEPCTKTLTSGLYSFFSFPNAIWTAQVSRAAGILAYGGEDGFVAQIQISEQVLANDRQRTKAPHYLCGQIKEDKESGVLSIISADTTSPVQLRKHRNETRQTPLAKVLFESKCSYLIEDEDKSARKKPLRAKQPVRRKAKSVVNDADEDTPLALLMYSPDTISAADTGYPTLAFITGNNQLSEVKNGLDGEVCSSEKVEGKTPGGWQGSLSSKLESIYRIRWNPNKGWENWLCFGGAGGILRCQLVYPSVRVKRSI